MASEIHFGALAVCPLATILSRHEPEAVVKNTGEVGDRQDAPPVR